MLLPGPIQVPCSDSEVRTSKSSPEVITLHTARKAFFLVGFSR